MIERYPKYYEDFSCIAGACEDTCCAGWEIDIDDESYSYYMQVEGEFGKRIRENIKEYDIKEEQYESHGFCLTERKRCPFLNEHNLCDIILNLGEEAICDVCTYTPRNFLEYGGVREISISPSCAEAGRLIFGQKNKVTFCERESGEALSIVEEEDDILWAKQVMQIRDGAIFLFQNREKPLHERVADGICYAHKIQEYFNREDYDGAERFAKNVLEEEHVAYQQLHRIKTECESRQERILDCYNAFCMRVRAYSELDSIGDEWETTLQGIWKVFLSESGKENYLHQREAYMQYIEQENREFEFEQMLVYEAFLFLGRCVDDDNFWGKMQYVIAGYLMMKDMDTLRFYEKNQHFTLEDRIDIARIYAKEIEHSQDNLDILEEAFLFEDCFTIENMLMSI